VEQRGAEDAGLDAGDEAQVGRRVRCQPSEASRRSAFRGEADGKLVERDGGVGLRPVAQMQAVDDAAGVEAGAVGGAADAGETEDARRAPFRGDGGQRAGQRAGDAVGEIDVLVAEDQPLAVRLGAAALEGLGGAGGAGDGDDLGAEGGERGERSRLR
jgi:hypothetical protein